MLATLIHDLNSLFFPGACLSCGSDEGRSDQDDICPACWEATRLFSGSEAICDKCGLLLGASKVSPAVYCHRCTDHHYSKARAAGIYESALRSTVIRLKSRPLVSYRAAQALEQAYERLGVTPEAVFVPVPLSPSRYRERGFNQAEIIARALGSRSGNSVDTSSLIRTSNSPIHRIGMDRKARDLSVRNAFAVARPKLIDGQSIILIDDVFTTGATVSHCAKALRKAGAAEVKVLTLARATHLPVGPE